MTSPVSKVLWKKPLYPIFRGNTLGAVLFRGTSGIFLVKTFGAGLAFALQVILARSLGHESYGVYIYVLTWIFLLSLLVKFGFDKLLVRLLSEYKTQQNWAKMRGLIRRSFQIVFCLSFFTAVVGVIFVHLFVNSLDRDLSITFYWGFILLPLIALNKLWEGALTGIRKVVLAKLPFEIFRPLIIIMFVFLYGLYFGSPNAEQAIIITTTSFFLLFLINLCFWMRNCPIMVRGSPTSFSSFSWTKSAFPFMLIGGSQWIHKTTDIIMIGAFVGAVEAGLYAVVTRVVTLISFGLSSVNSIAAPLISELYTKKDIKKLQKMVSTIAWFSLLCIVLFTVFFILYGQNILGLFGSEFSSGYNILLILMIGQIINALGATNSVVLTMTGHQSLASKIFGVSAFLNILLNALLIPVFGIFGAACATAFTTALWNITLVLVTWKLMRVNTTIFHF